MADEKREVNFSEEINLSNESTEEIETNEEIETSENEKETQEDSSPQENQEESEESSEEESKEQEIESSDVPKEPKPVEGETPRERALRLETQRLRKDLREERNRKVFEGHKPEVKDNLSDEDRETLSQYDEKELSQFEKVIDVVAKKKGWVKKDEFQASTYQQQASDILDGWLEDHREYLPENDKDNLLWGKFQEEFSMYRKPDNPKDLKKIFNKVHRDVFGISDGINSNKINAQKEKLKIASHSGTNQKSHTIHRQQSTIDPSLKEYLKGFSEEEQNEILG